MPQSILGQCKRNGFCVCFGSPAQHHIAVLRRTRRKPAACNEEHAVVAAVCFAASANQRCALIERQVVPLQGRGSEANPAADE